MRKFLFPAAALAAGCALLPAAAQAIGAIAPFTGGEPGAASAVLATTVGGVFLVVSAILA